MHPQLEPRDAFSTFKATGTSSLTIYSNCLNILLNLHNSFWEIQIELNLDLSVVSHATDTEALKCMYIVKA